jgi:hypothetical protein
MYLFNKSFALAENFQTMPNVQTSGTGAVQRSAGVQFVTQTFANAANFADPATGADIATRVQDYAGKYCANIIMFLLLTETTNATIKTNKIFTDLNDVAIKEAIYYKGVNEQMKNSMEKLKSVTNLTKLNSVSHKYRLFFLLSLTLILSITIYIWIYFSTPTVFILSDLIAIIAFTLYIISISFNVRTDSDKYYWTASIKNISQYE